MGVVRQFLKYPLGRRDVLISVLILGVSLSPEIPIAGVSTLNFTVRFEDLLLIGVTGVWLIWPKWESRVPVPGLFKHFTGYIVITGSLCVVNSLLVGLPIIRATFYLLKQFEVMLFGVLVAGLVSENRNLKTVQSMILIGPLLNATWAIYQIVAGDYGPQFYTAEMGKYRYGTSLIGQPAVLASGGYYLPALCLAAANVMKRDGRATQFKYSLFTCLLIVAMARAVLRASILATMTALGVIIAIESDSSARDYVRMAIPTGASAGFVLLFLPFPIVGYSVMH